MQKKALDTLRNCCGASLGPHPRSTRVQSPKRKFVQGKARFVLPTLQLYEIVTVESRLSQHDVLEETLDCEGGSIQFSWLLSSRS